MKKNIKIAHTHTHISMIPSYSFSLLHEIWNWWDSSISVLSWIEKERVSFQSPSSKLGEDTAHSQIDTFCFTAEQCEMLSTELMLTVKNFYSKPIISLTKYHTE